MSRLLALVTLIVAAQRANAVVPLWGQCGGMNWTGETTCASGSFCQFGNPYYSQCVPGTGPTTEIPTPTSTYTPPTSTYEPPTSTYTPPTTTPTQPTGPLATSLNGRFVNTGRKFWGAAADPNTLNIASNVAILASEFGAVTPENSMKWDAIEPSRNQFSYGNADTLVNWATSNGKLVRGHTFVWHSQLPSWVSSITDRSTLTTVIQSHIAALGGRYRGKIYAWDVVNEIFNEDGSLRSSVFANVFGGDSFVNVAFQAARDTDSSAKLYINDYNLDSPNAKLNAVVALVKKVNSGSKLIDGIGTQMHLGAGVAGSTIPAVQTAASADVDVAITELDIEGASPVDYTIVLQACILSPRCVSITSWGISDANSWRPSITPLIFDSNYGPKSAYFALMEALPPYPQTPTDPGTPTTTTTNPGPTQTTTQPSGPLATSLDGRFKNTGRAFWGAAADQGTLNKADNVAILQSEFGAVTPENSMKWDQVEATQFQFNFAAADYLVDWATSNNKLIRGHTFVWHSQLPSWVSSITSKDSLTLAIQLHIAQLGGHFRGKVYAWDVVNEIFNEDGSLRSSVFSNVFGGDSFVNVAFQAARDTDASAKLYINDYNLDAPNAKVNAIVALVKKVNSGTKLIDGIGTQMHLSAGAAGGTIPAVSTLASADVDIAITELDIAGASPVDYSIALQACLLNAKCVSITSWGVGDADSWRADTTPLIFDKNYFPKDAYFALMETLPPYPTGPTPTTTTTQGPGPTQTGPTQTGPPGGLATSLDGRFKNAGKLFFGAAADPATLSGDSGAILESEFGAVTPENSMKWENTEATRGQFTFTDSDALVSWATSKGKLIRGSVLVWHSQLPSWVSAITDRTTLTTVIQEHISGVAGHFKGKWDVVSEILLDNGSLRPTVFSNVFGGDGFVNVAFQAARAVDSSAKLYINEYGLDAPNAKVTALVALVKKVNSGTKLIDGIGSQSHLVGGPELTSQIRPALIELAGAGVDVALTELEVNGASPVDYTIVVKTCVDLAECKSITTWGVADADSWNYRNTPLIFDINYFPKDAYFALMEFLPVFGPGGPITTTTSPTTSPTTTSTGPTSTAIATSLHGRFVNAGKTFFGAAVNVDTLNDADSVDILSSEFGSLTATEALTWSTVEPSRDQFTWTKADTLINWATSKGKLVRGTSFVWHSSLPSWVSSITDQTTLTTVIQSHIATIAGRYRGKWDVVNEILNDDGSLRSSVFSRVFGGDGFVNVAFQAARAADPSAKLYINDYGLDTANAKVTAIVNLVKKVNSGTKLIDGIGSQTRLAGGPSLTSQVRSALVELAKAGVDIALTEVEINGASPVDYTILVKTCIDIAECRSLTTWGVTDADTPNYRNTPLIFDINHFPKDAYFALMEFLPPFPSGGGQVTTTTSRPTTTPTSTSTSTSTSTTSISTPTTTRISTTTTTTSTTTTSSVATPTGSASPTGLHARFRAKGKKFWGTCADSNTLNIAANAAVIRTEFGQLTPENSMKWDAIESSRGNFNFGGADTLVNWATSNGKLIRGHTFVWHSQLPGWVDSINDRTTLTSVIENHIQQLGGRYAGKIYAWDVVNEMFNEDGSVRSSVFSRVFGGDGFVNVAFAAARRADPKAVLYINDYNLDSANSKTNGMVNLVKKVNGGGTRLIDGCGTQMHLNANGAGGTAAAVNALAGADCEVAITELDIQQASANDYTTVLRACLNQARCAAITSWGVSDTNSWRASTNPLLFNGSYQPKAAYTALISALA